MRSVYSICMKFCGNFRYNWALHKDSIFTGQTVGPRLNDINFYVMCKKHNIMFILTYKCIHGCAPLYLQELIQMYKSTRKLRSSSKQLLVQSPSSTKTYGLRAFQHSSPELWNKLPNHIKNAKTLVQFKTSLKTYLFNVSD